ncbi:MAG: leucine/isoleucine/valine transporter permease subunit [Chloroflexi bacterium]|nr:leucine/isoleucine/valine transporter permease subunit [Chloroflexota bacterium]
MNPAMLNVTPRAKFAPAIRVGALGGIIIVFMGMIGMLETFSKRQIIFGVLDMGHLIIFVVFYLTAYFALKRPHGQVERSQQGRWHGGVAGLVNAASLVVLAIILTILPAIRNVFVNMTPALLELITFEKGLAVGSILLLIAGAGLGAFVGYYFYRPNPILRELLFTISLVLLIGLLQDLLRVTFQYIPFLSAILFETSGLSLFGAALLFAIILGGFEQWRRRGDGWKARYNALPTPKRKQYSRTLFGFLIAVVLLLPWILGLFFSEILVNVGLFVLMGLGLNIVVGFAGLLDLGYVAFFAIGAYTMGVLTTLSPEIAFHPGLNFWIILPFALVISVFGGIVLGVPVLRIRGDYLAIVTLGFGEIIRLLALSDALKPYFGGSRGIEAIPKPFIGPLELIGPQQMYYLVIIGCLIVAFIALRLKNSRLGRAWMAIREDEDVAQSMGIDLVKTKLLAFGIGASFAGIGGAIFASKLGTIYPHSFNLIISINVLALLIIGGMGNIPGVIIGSLVLVGLPELFREFEDYRLLVYGAVLVIMMLAKPEGLLPEARRAMELEEFRHTDDAVPPEGITGTLKNPGQA